MRFDCHKRGHFLKDACRSGLKISTAGIHSSPTFKDAVFYPPALANLVLNLALFQSFSLFALELEALVHFFLAGAFTYLFARRVLLRTNELQLPYLFHSPGTREFSSAPSFLLLAGISHPTHPSTRHSRNRCLAAVSALLLDRALPDNSPDARAALPQSLSLSFVVRRSSLVASGIVLGVAALAGHPQTFLFVVAICVIYFVWRAAQVVPGRTAPFTRRALLASECGSHHRHRVRHCWDPVDFRG